MQISSHEVIPERTVGAFFTHFSTVPSRCHPDSAMPPHIRVTSGAATTISPNIEETQPNERWVTSKSVMERPVDPSDSV
jgi:hypothetical protein